MQLYVGSSTQFMEDAFLGSIGQKLERAFFDHFRYKASPGEVQSWQNSLMRMSMVLQKAELTDHGVILEHQLPLTSKRLDCMVLGEDGSGQDQAVVVELKQWSKAEASDADACVATYVGGRVRDVLHPSVQVGQYAQYLGDYQTVFSEDGMGLVACAYLHNVQFDPGDELFHEKHRDALERYPLFTGDRSNELAGFLAGRMEHGEGDRVLNRVLESPFRPSRKLLQHTAEMIEGKDVFTLLDEQLVVFERVLAEGRKSFHRPEKAAVLVRGGPGTGKSVVALHLVGRLAQEGYNAQHATGSKAFTGNVRSIVGRRAANQVRYFTTAGIQFCLGDPNPSKSLGRPDLLVQRDGVRLLVDIRSFEPRGNSHPAVSPRAGPRWESSGRSTWPCKRCASRIRVFCRCEANGPGICGGRGGTGVRVSVPETIGAGSG